jgi:hypothetical protein
MPDGSEAFAVHLQSLTDFANELTTQLAGMVQPLAQMDSLVDNDLLLGEFTEAYSLWTEHGLAVSEMYVLIGQARDAIQFANEITETVSTAYQHYDDGVTATMSSVTAGITGTADEKA